MILPSKIASYNESTLALFLPILSAIEKEGGSVYEIVNLLLKKYELTEIVDALYCLYALGKIGYDPGKEKLYIC